LRLSSSGIPKERGKNGRSRQSAVRRLQMGELQREGMVEIEGKEKKR
jgi:hypothetical protein